MKKIILLSGGLGRGVAALPALIKFNRNNPDLEWYVSIPSWDYIGDCIPEIQHRIFDASDRNAWEHIFLKADVVITPEPYTLPNFYKGEINLVEAFDELINNTTDHSDLDYECLKLSGHELDQEKEVIMSIYDIYKKKRTVVINPYGSTAVKTRWGIRDETYRSMSENLFYKLCEKLVEKYYPIIDSLITKVNESKDYKLATKKNKNYHPVRMLHKWLEIPCAPHSISSHYFSNFNFFYLLTHYQRDSIFALNLV